MAYLCLDCFETYDGDNIKFDIKLEYNFCPKTKCHGKVVDVDELFVPIIRILNQKGYYTKYCCSGHILSDRVSSYISFEDDIKLPNLPEGYKYDKDLYPHINWDTIEHGGMICIRNNMNGEDEVITYCKLLENAMNVMKWVDSLEDICD